MFLFADDGGWRTPVYPVVRELSHGLFPGKLLPLGWLSLCLFYIIFCRCYFVRGESFVDRVEPP